MNEILVAQMFGILTALGFATCDSVSRYGMRTSTPITAILTLAIVTFALFFPIAISSFGMANFSDRGFWLLVGAGMASPGLAGTLFYMSMQRIGLSRTSCFAASSPLLGVIFGVVFLGERPAYWIFLGTLLIVGGMMFLSWDQRKGTGRTGERPPFWRDFGLAAAATLMFGMSALLRKAGIVQVPALSLGLSATAVGVFFMTLFLNFFMPEGNRIRFTRQSIGWFAAGGTLNSLAHMSFFFALQRAPLSLVIPLAYVTPIFTLGYSWLLFREMERLNMRLVAGALCICAGAAIVTLSRN